MRQVPIYLFFLCEMALAQSASHTYRMNPQGRCESVQDNLKSLDPIPLSVYPQIERKGLMSTNFLQKSSVCANAKTCLFPDRLERLHWNGKLPRPMNYPEFKEKIEDPKCLPAKASDYYWTSFDRIRHAITRTFVPAIESEMSVKMVNEVKDLVEQYRKASERGLNALIHCFEIDQELTKTHGDLSADKKLKIYNPDYNPNNRETHKLCDRIWDSSSAWNNLQTSLSDSRKALFAFHAFESEAVKDNVEFIKLLDGLKQGTQEAKSIARNIPLEPLNGEVLGLTKSQFWDDTPEVLEPLNDKEQEELLEYLTELSDKKTSDFSWQELAALNYFETISESPLLIYLNKANPSGADYLNALKNHKKKQTSSDPIWASDDQYLNFTSVFEAFLARQPPHLVGDYCVLAADLIGQRQRQEESITAVFMGTLLTSSAQAIGQGLLRGGMNAKKALTAQKGFNAKRARLFMLRNYKIIPDLLKAAPVSGMVLATTTLSQGVEKYSAMKAACSSTFQTSNELCNIGALESTYTSNTLAIGMGLFFSGKNLQKFLIPPALLTSDQ